jgi:7-cyano-7-deazaguanine synthase in queuosine biosynthesis
MIVIPIGFYFLAVSTFLRGRNSWAAALAALLANVVLITYIVVAMREDEAEQDGRKPESKKTK